MRAILAALLIGLGLWQAAADWQATIGQGYAYRLTPLGQILADAAPDTYARVLASWQATRVPFLWDPIGRVLMALPVAAVLLGAGLLLWVTRRRGEPRRR